MTNDTLLHISLSPEEIAHLRSHRIWLRDREHVVAVARETGIENLRPSQWGQALYSFDAVLTHRDEFIEKLEAEIAALRARLNARQEAEESSAQIPVAMEGIAVANDTLLHISQSPEESARFRSRRIWLQDREHEQKK